MLKKTALFGWFLFILGLLGVVNVLLLADSVRGLHLIVERIGVDPVVFWILSLAVLIGVRVFKKVVIPVIFFYTYLYILVPLTTVLAIAATYLELSHFHNYLYTTYFIYFDRIVLWAIASWTFVLVLAPEKVWKKYWQSIVLGLPVGLLAAMALIWTWPQDIFLQLVKEDDLIENAQVLVLVIGAVSAFLLAKNFLKKRLAIMAGLFLIVSCGLFFIAGDEIAWGQRLIGFGTPEQLAEQNLQQETTVHNLDGFHQLVGYGYILIGVYGAFAWIVSDNFLKRYSKWLKYFIPPSYLFFFFYLSLVYNAYALGGVNDFKEWSEIAELMLYSGISLFLLIYFLEIKSKKF